MAQKLTWKSNSEPDYCTGTPRYVIVSPIYVLSQFIPVSSQGSLRLLLNMEGKSVYKVTAP